MMLENYVIILGFPAYLFINPKIKMDGLLWGTNSMFLFRYKEIFMRFLKFCLVGSAGLLLNLFLVYLFTDIWGIWYLLSFLIATFFTWTFIFFTNSLFTFHDRNTIHYFKNYTSFMLGYAGLFWVNLAMVYIFTSILSFYYLLSIVIGTIITTILTFAYNNRVVFRSHWKSEENK